MTATAAAYMVGCSRAEITPALSVPYLGFSPRHCAFEGVHDPLHVRAVSVSDGTNRVIVISADLIGIDNQVLGPGRHFTAELRARIQEQTGVPPDAVMLACAHIHSTPDTLNFRPLRDAPGAVEWLEALSATAVRCAAEAVAAELPARCRLATRSVTGWTHNRRDDPCTDDLLSILSFDPIADNRRVVLVHFTCHPVILQVQPLVSGDYVGAMCGVVKDARRAPARRQLNYRL